MSAGGTTGGEVHTAAHVGAGAGAVGWVPSPPSWASWAHAGKAQRSRSSLRANEKIRMEASIADALTIAARSVLRTAGRGTDGGPHEERCFPRRSRTDSAACVRHHPGEAGQVPWGVSGITQEKPDRFRGKCPVSPRRSRTDSEACDRHHPGEAGQTRRRASGITQEKPDRLGGVRPASPRRSRTDSAACVRHH